MKLSESINKQYKQLKKVIDGYSYTHDWNDACEDEVKTFLRTAIRQACLDIVPEEKDMCRLDRCDVGGYLECRSELLKRINE